jgi:hypothetical protein
LWRQNRSKLFRPSAAQPSPAHPASQPASQPLFISLPNATSTSTQPSPAQPASQPANQPTLIYFAAERNVNINEIAQKVVLIFQDVVILKFPDLVILKFPDFAMFNFPDVVI